MSRRNRSLSEAEHRSLANLLRLIDEAWAEAGALVFEARGVSSREGRVFDRTPNGLPAVSRARSLLDDHYLEDTDRPVSGSPYYGGDP